MWTCLKIEVWRNSPVEDVHAGRRGPSDAVMFAESTALHQEAVRALTADRVEYGLIDFEKHLLDRSQEWAGTGGKTLRELGHGFLGHYDKHVKGCTNALLSLLKHTCVENPAGGVPRRPGEHSWTCRLVRIPASDSIRNRSRAASRGRSPAASPERPCNRSVARRLTVRSP